MCTAQRTVQKRAGISVQFVLDLWLSNMPASTGKELENHQERFKTPHATLFTQSWIPIEEGPVKGIVCMTHGYGSDTGWLFQKIAIAYAQWGYAVFGADLLGHGRSDGIRCYMGDMEKVAAASLHFFKAMRDSETYKGLPAFLFGESIGVAATLLMYFQDSNGWDGIIFSDLASDLVEEPSFLTIMTFVARRWIGERFRWWMLKGGFLQMHFKILTINILCCSQKAVSLCAVLRIWQPLLVEPPQDWALNPR